MGNYLLQSWSCGRDSLAEEDREKGRACVRALNSEFRNGLGVRPPRPRRSRKFDMVSHAAAVCVRAVICWDRRGDRRGIPRTMVSVEGVGKVESRINIAVQKLKGVEGLVRVYKYEGGAISSIRLFVKYK